MRRRDFLALSAAAVSSRLTRASGAPRIRQTARAYTFDANPTGRTLKTPDGRIVFDYVTKKPADTENEWTVLDTVYMNESVTAAVHEGSNTYVLDLTHRFAPKDVDVVLPTWSFGGLCVSGRSDAESAHYEGPAGRVDRGNPSMIDGETSWPDADWYSRTHVLAGKTAGYGVVNHPANPKTRWWNPPTTGNINPSIVTYGDVTIPHDQPLVLKYRVIAYDVPPSPAQMNELSAEFRKA